MPQSKPAPASAPPPRSEKTTFPEPCSISKFAILNGTSRVGEPPSPVLLAVIDTVVAGQSQKEDAPVQAGSTLEEGGAKNRPFEPVSRKERVRSCPWSVVAKVPLAGLTGKLVAPVSLLLAWVPMPRSSVPSTGPLPPSPTDGSSTITPLLSLGS